MKSVLSIAAMIVFLASVSMPASGQDYQRSRGIGAILGDPTGISVSYRVSQSNAFSGAAAWHLRDNPKLHLHLDYLFYRFNILEVDRGALPLYFGAGGRLRFDNDNKLGIRFPAGIAYHFDNDPFELFLEIVPILEVIPGTSITGNSGIGVRYYF